MVAAARIATNASETVVNQTIIVVDTEPGARHRSTITANDTIIQMIISAINTKIASGMEIKMAVALFRVPQMAQPIIKIARRQSRQRNKTKKKSTMR